MKAILFAALIMIAMNGQTPKSDSESKEVWGGEHVRLEASSNGAELEFDCATGKLSEAIPESDGTHTIDGTFSPEHGGPVRRDEPAGRPVTYRLVRAGKQLQMEIMEAGETVETYSLTQGSSGHVMKCK
jgi:hypothetical protein